MTSGGVLTIPTENTRALNSAQDLVLPWISYILFILESHDPKSLYLATVYLFMLNELHNLFSPFTLWLVQILNYYRLE